MEASENESLSAGPTVSSPGFWGTIRLSLAGGERDFTQGSIGRAIIMLAIPMVLEMSMESLFAIVDAYFVSRLGVDAVATVGFTEALLTVLYAMAVGVSMGTGAMVARRIGEKDKGGAAVAAVQSIAVGIGVAAIVSVPGVIFAPALLRLMGGSPEVAATGAGYTAVSLGGSVTVMLLFLLNSVFRGAGDAAVAMRVLWIANGINIVLDPCFIFGFGPFPELGVTGAAVATVIGRGTGVLLQLWVMFLGRARVGIGLAQLRLDSRVMLALLRVSAGGILQFLIGTSSWIFLVWIVGRFGSAAVAGYTIAIRIIIFALLPSWGLSNAAATLVGQNLGAQRPDRAEQSVWRTGFYNMLFLVGLALVLITCARFIVGFFSDEPAVVASAVDCVRYICYGYGFYAYGMVMVQAFNGAGDTMTPTVINLFGYWVLQIPLAYLLANGAEFGAAGVYAAIMITESLIAVTGIMIFRRGRWKSKKI